MQLKSATRAAPATPRRPARSLAARHPQALYRFVPPFACDDDGYPFEDSAVSESDVHSGLRDYLRFRVRARFAGRTDVTVRADNALYFERGNRAAAVSPDLFVAFGTRPRGGAGESYKVWEEGALPALTVEILSKGNWKNDVGPKRALYEELGVREYWMLDPVGLTARPVVGLRLGADGRYREIAPGRGGGRLSAVLGLEFAMLGGECRLRDPATGGVMPTAMEEAAARLAAEREREAAVTAYRRERSMRETLEARVAALEARIRDES